MPSVVANGIRLEVEQHGTRGDTPILLIRGLGSQLIQWPPDLIGDLVKGGCHVVTFDNRDAGLSGKCDGLGAYSLTDMADDTVALMDALGLPKAHVLGMSMGGMILQIMALHHPDRLLSGTALMSSSRAPYLPKATPDVQAALLPVDHGRDIARRVHGARLIEVDGMGHDLEGDLPRIVSKHVLDFVETVDQAANAPKE
ncbi:MAG: alpha/beta hydrolase [Pseudomonadota bacterium]